MGKSTLGLLLGLSLAVILSVCNGASLSTPTPATVIAKSTENDALVITTTESATQSSAAGQEEFNDLATDVESDADVAPTKTEVKQEGGNKPQIYYFHIESNIKYRYSRTFVTSRVANTDPEKSQEAVFKVVLPETAFISKFLMTIDGKEYEAYVKEKEVAKKIYNEAQQQGQSAGLVEVNTRNANVFNVNVNVKAGSKVNFNLTYEELLSRRLGRYEQAINIIPDQIHDVKEFQVKVNIEESQNITLLRVPQIRNDIEAESDNEGNNPDAVILRPAGNKANVSWTPSKKDQTALSKDGAIGKFIIQYDIKRELDAGEVLIMNGYFVHFFAPDNLKPLRKHVVFILDISGSMWGQRLVQLKESMNKILADMNDEDFFNIITFSSGVTLWGLDDKISKKDDYYSFSSFEGPSEAELLKIEAAKRYPIAASKGNIVKAQAYIDSLQANGGTNIHDAIIKALNLTSEIKSARKQQIEGITTTSTTSTTTSTTTTTTTATEASSSTSAAVLDTTTVKAKEASVAKAEPVLPAGVESLILFLTDGEPTVGETNPTAIQTLIKKANMNESVPIFSLAFGEGADFPFVRKLSLQNNGFARKIYEASDATLQLKGFYNEIASPLLSNVKFNYTSPIGEISNLTITKYPTVFGGTEIAICGTFDPKPNENDSNSTADAEIVNGTTTTTSTTSASVNKTARLEDSETGDIGFDHDEPCVYNDKLGFQVSVVGNGRDGNEMTFRRPCVWSSPIPWGVPALRPFPARPTPPPTLEDTFLEKMWAYLTIRQLIDKDLAAIETAPTIEDEDLINSGEETSTTTTTTTTAAPAPTAVAVVNGTSANVAPKAVVPETPKQKALRLALKYGFVTSLTSLVVVKPNNTDVQDARPADGKPADSSMGFPLSKVQFAPFALSARARHPAQFLRSYSPARSLSPGPQPQLLSDDYGISAYAAYDDVDSEAPMPQYAFAPQGLIASRPIPVLATQFPSFGGPAYQQHPGVSNSFGPPGLVVFGRPQPSSSGVDYDVSPEAAESTTTPPLLEASTNTPSALSSVQWTGDNANATRDGTVKVKGISYGLVLNKDEIPSYTAQECGKASNATAAGTCVHVIECVQPEFATDFNIYEQQFFCTIVSEGRNYAGACCPTKKEKSQTPVV